MTSSWRLAGAATEANQLETNERLAAIASGSANWATTQIPVTDKATPPCPARAGRRSLTLTNLGVTAVYLGGDDSVSIASGVPLPGVVGATKTVEMSAAIWAIVADVGSVAVEELF
jgi:hypothetical protein